MRHLKKKHKNNYEAALSPGPSQPTINQFASASTPYSNTSSRKKNLDEKLARFLAKDMRPTTLVEGNGFKEFIRALDPRYKVPSRGKVAKGDLPALEENVKADLKDQLRSALWASFTTDIWTSRKNTPFITITVHFLAQGKLQTKVLGCIKFWESHTSQHIEEKMRGILEEFDLQTKIVTGTTDNAHNIVKAVRDLLGRHVPCFAHCLNLCANDSLDLYEDLKESRQKVMGLIKEMNYSSKAKKVFMDCQERLNIRPFKPLIAEVKTRWNSTFLMFQRALELKDAITLYQVHSGQEQGLSPQNWDYIKKALRLLRPLYEATVEMSGEQYVTGSKVVPMSKTLLGWYSGEETRLQETSEGSFEHCFSRELLHALERRLGKMEDIKELAAATLLDPRFKREGFRNSEKAAAAVGWIQGVLQAGDGSPPTETEQPQDTGESLDSPSLWSSFDSEVQARNSFSVANAGT